MGVFSPEVYTHSTPGKAFFHLTVFIAAAFGLVGAVYMLYPDRPAAPRTFYDNGLERALGGKNQKTILVCL
jgi:NADH dehydrogenase (ubiquinone) 1 beta subcomplex subunit 8